MTDYDRQHLVLYVRLLEAAEEGAEWTEVVRILFGLVAPALSRQYRLIVAQVARHQERSNSKLAHIAQGH